MKFMTPSQIQASSIPLITKTEYHLLAQAKNGSGKTLAFLVGTINKIDIKDNNLQVLIIAPNRELMNQIYGVMVNISKFLNGLKTCKISDIDLKNPEYISSHIIIATPGACKSALNSNKININNLKYLVMDEIDETISNYNDELIEQSDHSSQIFS